MAPIYCFRIELERITLEDDTATPMCCKGTPEVVILNHAAQDKFNLQSNQVHLFARLKDCP